MVSELTSWIPSIFIIPFIVVISILLYEPFLSGNICVLKSGKLLSVLFWNPFIINEPSGAISHVLLSAASYGANAPSNDISEITLSALYLSLIIY